MARAKADLAYHIKVETEAKAEYLQAKARRREAEEAARRARLASVGELAEKFGIAHIPATVLAGEFKRIAAEHPSLDATESSADDANDTAEAVEVAQTPAGGAAQAESETERAPETAEAGGETKRWKWK